MNREEMMNFLRQYLTSEHLIKHSLAVEAVMKRLAEHFNVKDMELWSKTGLLHDLDADMVNYEVNPHLHGPETVRILKEKGIGNEDMYHAILSHNMITNIPRISTLDKALFSADPITGFITAVTLVRPDKRIDSVQVKSVKKKVKDKGFAAGANRDAMKSIEALDLAFDDFIQLSLDAMKEIHEKLEL
ncbi:MAG: HD domain-containing protein [Eubacteriales bacterium]